MTSEKIAVGYVRCSTEMQEDSPEQQKRAIIEFAQTKGFRVCEWYVDFGKSGTTFDQRSEFLRLLKAVDTGAAFSAVICYDESRWGRAIESEENTYWRVHFRKRGVDVLLVKTSVDPKHEFAPMFNALEGIQASQYSKKLSELTLRGAKNNGVYSSGGTAPYGYKRIGVNLKTGEERDLADGDWSVRGQEKVRWATGNPEEVEIVDFIFSERANGKAYVLIAENLNNRCIDCPRRGRWRSKDRKWSAVTIKSILDNAAYYGARVYNKNSMSKIVAQQRGREAKYGIGYPHWKNPREEWITEESAHPAIVSKELWQRTQAVNKATRSKRGNQYSVRGTYLLSGLVRCSKCGFSFQGSSSTAKGRPYFRYIDSGWVNKRVCSFLSLPKEKLEEQALRAIKQTLLQPGMSDRISNSIASLIENRPKAHETTRQHLQAALRKIDLKRDNLLEAIELSKAGSTKQDILKRLEGLEGEKNNLSNQVAALDAQNASSSDLAKAGQLATEFVRKFDDLFASAPIEERKILLKKCISRVIVDRERGVVRFGIWLLPAVTSEIEALYANKTAPATRVASAASSGDPHFRLCTTA